ncbi:tRNA lysidine(34) synthetase TilS [Butyrivibrio sp. CB08]|uniref:tRNA lysidine(34) synthetase TilS n=1 Tax=Butyrivibrio sp. CB08 TaxID=2364879 RepID=UPI0013147447|nr:tRNA lysidine(34) synthetase TilS [Butyrivibrio sp. CB08]
MFQEESRVVVGFSGGADSVALMEVLCDLKDLLKISIFPIHLNHMIRQEAGEDEEFCRAFCADKGVPFKSVSVDIPSMAKEKSLTEEEAGRYARYEAFESYADEVGASYIAVAHHQNDVAETLLMNLLRGSGLHGASAIRPVRGNVVRPLLGVTRQEIEEFLRKRDISFCIDKTNLEDIHTRNYLRNQIIPELEDRINDRAVEHLASAASSFDKADEFIRGYAKEIFQRIVSSAGDKLSVNRSDLLTEKEIIQENIVLMMFEELVRNRKDIGAVHVDAVLSLLHGTDGQTIADLPYGLVAKRTYDRLEIGKKGNPKESFEEVSVSLSQDEETEITVPVLGRVKMAVFPYNKVKEVPTETYTKWLDYGRIQEVSFRTRRGDDYICINTSDGNRKKPLSKFMTDVKIPKDERDEMVIVADGSHVLWVPGYRLSASCKVSEATKYILEIKIDDGGINNG